MPVDGMHIDCEAGDQLEAECRGQYVTVGVAEAGGAGWQHAALTPQQARELAKSLDELAARV